MKKLLKIALTVLFMLTNIHADNLVLSKKIDSLQSKIKQRNQWKIEQYKIVSLEKSYDNVIKHYNRTMKQGVLLCQIILFLNTYLYFY